MELGGIEIRDPEAGATSRITKTKKASGVEIEEYTSSGLDASDLRP